MKCNALILSLCLLVYIAELVALPASIIAPAAPAKTMCCSKMAEAAQPSCKKEPPCKKQKGCNAQACCINCPLCYAVTMPVEAVPAKRFHTIDKEYADFQSNYLFIYYSTAWKPPNGC